MQTFVGATHFDGGSGGGGSGKIESASLRFQMPAHKTIHRHFASSEKRAEKDDAKNEI